MQKKSKSKQTAPRRQKPSVVAIPAAISYGSKAKTPKVVTRADGTARIRRTEFVGTVSNGSVTGYTLLGLSQQTPGYDLNPGCNDLFPWLSEIARNYEKFHFNSIRFRVTPSQATATAGRLYLAVDYDYDDNPPTSKAQMMSNQTHVEGSVWSELQLSCIPSELHSDGRMKYVSHATRANFVEPRTAYCGYLVIATDSPTANLQFDLEVQYDVDLYLPVIDEPTGVDTYLGAPLKTVSADLLNATGPSAGYVCRPCGQDITVQGGIPVLPVFPGTADCPPLNFAGNSTYPVPNNGPNALDLKFAKASVESIGLCGSITATGITPHTLKTTNNILHQVDVFDSLGTYLGTVNPSNTTIKGISYTSDASNTGWNVAGNPLQWVINLGLSALLEAYPRARFLVPYAYAVLAQAIATGGTTKSGLKLL